MLVMAELELLARMMARLAQVVVLVMARASSTPLLGLMPGVARIC